MTPVAHATRPTRPGGVLCAAACFWLAALMLLAQLPQVVFDLTTIGGLTRDAGARTGASAHEIRDEINGAHVFDLVIMLVLLGLAAALAVSAARFAQGHDRGRFAALAAAAVVLLCCTGALVGTVVGGRQPDASEFQRQVTQLAEAHTPGWVTVLTFAALSVYPLLVAGAVLLLLPASNRYFRPFAGFYVYPLPPTG